MKSIMKVALVALALSAGTSSLFAAKPQDKREKRQRPTAEQRAQRIALQLAFDDATTAKFVEVYTRQQEEMKALRPAGCPLQKADAAATPPAANGNQPAVCPAKPAVCPAVCPKRPANCAATKALTEAEAEQVLKERLEHRQKMLDLQEKYYKEYSKFLTQKQLLRVQELCKNGHRHQGRRQGFRQGKRQGCPQDRCMTERPRTDRR